MANKLAVITVISKTNVYYCVGLEFTQSPRVLSIAAKEGEANAAKGIITEEQATELRADPFITVIEGEGAEVSSEQAQALAAANAELEALHLRVYELEAKLADAIAANLAFTAAADAVVKAEKAAVKK